MLTYIIVSKIGYYTPFILVGGIGAAVAGGLMTTFKPTSGAAAWVCYQLLLGTAQGFIRQQPLTAVQAVISKDQLAVANSLITFSQMFGSSIFVSFGQTAFANSLKSSIKQYAPGVDANEILSVGATNFRTVVPDSAVPGVILAYNKALTSIFVGFSFAIKVQLLTQHLVYLGSHLLLYIYSRVWPQMD